MTRIQRGFLFDPNRCLGCQSCVVACATGKNLPSAIYLRRIEMQEFPQKGQIVKYFLSTSCHHCLNPECMRLCPQQALHRRQDGIVLHDEIKCDGCGTCTRSCPFEAPVMDASTGTILKCDACYDRLDVGELPFCVSACPVEALRLVNINHIDKSDTETVHRLHGVIKIQITRPSVRYIPLKLGRQVLRYRKGDEHENRCL